MGTMSRRNNLKPGQIRVTPSDNRLNEMPPYVNGVEKAPMWFRSSGKKPGSIRRCAGVGDYLSTGVTIPAWTHFDFKPGIDGQWETRASEFGGVRGATSISSIEGFSFDSTGQCPVTDLRSAGASNAQYPKLVNPWRIETAPGWSVLFLPTLWEPNVLYDVLPAIVHTDFYHTANIVLNIKTDQPFSIKWGTPLAHLIPFERKNDISELITADESQFKYVASTGFGIGHVMPIEGTAAPYRRNRIAVDRDLELEKNRGIIKKLLSR